MVKAFVFAAVLALTGCIHRAPKPEIPEPVDYPGLCASGKNDPWLKPYRCTQSADVQPNTGIPRPRFAGEPGSRGLFYEGQHINHTGE